MAACSDLELEEKSSEERLPRPVRTEDAMSQSANLNTCNEVTSSYRTPANSPQPEEQSETGDLNKLSDDEFLHLLEEASTFNKPNNQESVLLKQLRKEVAETDPCDNVSRTKPARVSDGSHSKRSKYPSGYCKNRESGLVRSGVADSDAVSLPQRTLDYNVRRKNEKLGRSREYPNIKNNALTASGLGKSGHQSQSLQDLVNSDLVKSTGHSYRKLQRAQRAASFSSAPEDQDSELEFESFRTSFKYSKRTKQQMHNSASFGAVSESSNSSDKNKTSTSSSKHDGEEAKSRNRRLGTFEVQDHNTTASPLPVTSTSDHMDSPLETEKDSLAVPESPGDSQEIEMKDISSICVRGDHANDENESQSGKGDQQSNSKFYVNCTDVDSPLTFPLKLVSTNGEINKSGLVNEAVNDKLTCQQVNFPMPWNRPMQVHSFLSTTPVDHEAYPAKKEKQIFGSDVNGNPFSSKTSRTPNLTSFTVLDYPGNNIMVSESQTAKLDWAHRKNKRTRNSVESQNVVFSENIAGHRGKESIDSLIKYINSSDKKSKNGKGANSNQTIINKSAISNESDKKKILAKGLKNCHNKNIINTAKKKLSSPSNSEEECAAGQDQKSEVMDSVYSAVKDTCPQSNVEPDVKSSETSEENLDVNSNITIYNLGKKVDETSEAESSVISPPETREGFSSFAADFYLAVPPHATQEVLPHAVNEDIENFHVVKKKQRKKHTGKRSESHRWHSAAARAGQTSSDTRDYATEKLPNRSSMVLLPGMPLSQRNQCGKQDSRRKSTSSVPHSEQSSADNSDLDSVHSLPVKGSARHPTQPQPHTSPSSSSSTPQASYADIAKMPSVKSSPFCESLPTSLPMSKSTNKDADFRQPESCEMPLASSSLLETATQSKTTQTQTSALFAKNSSSVIIETEPSVPCASVSSNTAKSTREINTQTDPVSESPPLQDDRPKDKNGVRTKQGKDVSSSRSQNFSRPRVAKDKNVCNICHCTYKDGICNCNLKSDKNIPQGQKTSKDKRPAVIMMDSYSPSKNVCDISFGIDVDKLCEESSGENSCHTAASVDSTCHRASSPSNVSVVTPDEHLHEENVSSEVPRITSTTATIGSSGSDIGLQVNVCILSDNSVIHEAPLKVSSPLQKTTLPTGQVVYFRPRECNLETWNHEQVVNRIAADWKNVIGGEHRFYNGE